MEKNCVVVEMCDLCTECVISIVWIKQKIQLLPVWRLHILVHDVKITRTAELERTTNRKCIRPQQSCVEEVTRNVHARVA